MFSTSFVTGKGDPFFVSPKSNDLRLVPNVSIGVFFDVGETF
jgi:hypothetical protein